MVNPNLLISVGIWITGLGMTAIGIETTIRPPNEQTKWWYRGVFAALGIAFVGLSIWQFDRADMENKRIAFEHQQEQLRNEGNQRYLQGQLDSITKILNTVSTNSAPAQTIAALKAVLPVTTAGKPAIELMSNQQLRDKVIQFCKELRAFVAQNEQRQIALLNQQRDESMRIGRDRRRPQKAG